jgi:GTPase
VRTLQLIDLAGHEKYLKTTIFGLTGMMPDIGLVIVGANMGVKVMTKEHLAVAGALGIPVAVVLTKVGRHTLPDVISATLSLTLLCARPPYTVAG